LRIPSPRLSDSTLRKAELGAALFLTLEAIWLRVVAATSAGALWRDEANTVGLATLPSIRSVWDNLQWDSFPMLWILIVRAVSEFAGPMNDPAFRILGLVMGVGIIAALWFYARSFHYTLPLVSLALLALSPSVIVWGDSLRAYGLGILVVITFGALLWRFIEAPTTTLFVLAAIVGILSVHVLYYNAVLLLAFGAGAAGVAATRHEWKKIVLVGVIGILAAVSLLPYVEAIRAASDWSALFRVPQYTFLWFWSNLHLTLLPGGSWSLVLWTEFFVLAFVAAARATRYPGKLGHSPSQRDAALFSVVAMIVGSTGIFFFLKTLSYYTSPWYYVPLLALAAVCIDSISGSLIHSELARVARLGGVMVLGIATFLPALHAATTRMTNVDLIAYRTQLLATRSDLIVVTPWYNGVSWSRYYRGPARWMTLPPVESHQTHRPDVIKKHMIEADQTLPVRPVQSEIAATLRSGNRVFIVGGLPKVPPGKKPVILSRAPMDGNQWPSALYSDHWGLTLDYFLQQHSTNVSVIQVNGTQRVSDYEDLPFVVVTGWKP
jgi:hypothetical protein